MTARRSTDLASPDPEAVERPAAEWVLRCQRGLTAAEKREFARWLERNSSHAEIFAEMDETSRLLGRLRDSTLAAPKFSDASVSADSAEPHRPTGYALPRRQSWAWRSSTGLAAAAAIAIACVFWLPAPPMPFTYTESVTTNVGDLRRLELPDGTLVHVNTDTALAVEFTGGERRVRLTRGEAFFQVAHNRKWPFWVQAGAVDVRAVGTAFNVRYGHDKIEVLVREGKVSVAPAPLPIAGTTSTKLPVGASIAAFDRRMVGTGKKAVIALATNSARPSTPTVTVAPLARAQIESALAWHTRRLEFADVSLEKVVAEFNRYNHHQLVIDDPNLAAQVFGGAFSSNGYESFVEVLEQSFGVRAVRKERETVLHTR